MSNEQLKELLVEQIRDIYDAEKQLVKTLPKLAKASESEELGDAIRHHLDETQQQVSRLEQVFELLGAPAKGKACKGMRGLIEEGAEVLEEHDEGALRDLAIIAAAQRVEHYEISAYGTARAIAESMGNNRVVRLLQQTEEEEKTADGKLSDIAMSLYQAEEQEPEMATATAGRRSRSGSGK
jgi:ferritin-like metal-binding protein YciE